MRKFNLNLTTLTGAAAAGLVIYYGGLKAVKSPEMFLDSHAILLVVGGTLAATLMAFPFRQLTQLFDFVVFSVFTGRKTDYVKLVEELADINQNIQTPGNQIKNKEYSHYFVKEGVGLLHETSYSYDDLSDILDARVLAFKKKYQQDAKILNAIAKYPPAFGLLGATTGMIGMMTNLGGAGGTAAIGRAMAVALVATFWGIAAANFVFLPLSDNAQKAYLADEFTRNFIKEAILMIRKRTAQKVFIERLTSMLPLDERLEAKSNHFTPSMILPNNIVQMFTKKPRVSVTEPTEDQGPQTRPLDESGSPAGQQTFNFKNASVKSRTK
jgi:chemotaxis protein MotA